MAFDAHRNFAYSTVAAAPSPATTGSTLTVTAGEGARFPAAPFNVVVWPVGTQPLAGNAEIVRVTARSADTLTIARTQEGTTARAIVAGDQVSAAITQKTLADIEAATGGTPVYTAADVNVPDNTQMFVSVSLGIDTDGFINLDGYLLELD